MKIMLPMGSIFACVLFASVGYAAEDPSIAACKSTGLIALQQKSSDITDLILDEESTAISAADTKIEDTAIKTVVLGTAYMKRGESKDKPARFVCLIGEKGKVLLTFFTSK